MVSPPGFKPRSIGCQTCTLTATSKSPAEWHGSQSTHSCVVMAHLYTALTFGKRTLAHTHTHPHSITHTHTHTLTHTYAGTQTYTHTHRYEHTHTHTHTHTL